MVKDTHKYSNLWELQPSNIYLDDFLLPKIGDFGLSTRFYSQDNMAHQSMSGFKGTPVCSVPEILEYNEFSKVSDVYAFAFIVLEIVTTEKIFPWNWKHKPDIHRGCDQ